MDDGMGSVPRSFSIPISFRVADNNDNLLILILFPFCYWRIILNKYVNLFLSSPLFVIVPTFILNLYDYFFVIFNEIVPEKYIFSFLACHYFAHPMQLFPRFFLSFYSRGQTANFYGSFHSCFLAETESKPTSGQPSAPESIQGIRGIRDILGIPWIGASVNQGPPDRTVNDRQLGGPLRRHPPWNDVPTRTGIPGINAENRQHRHSKREIERFGQGILWPNPIEWLGGPFIPEMSHLESWNPWNLINFFIERHWKHSRIRLWNAQNS